MPCRASAPLGTRLHRGDQADNAETEAPPRHPPLFAVPTLASLARFPAPTLCSSRLAPQNNQAEVGKPPLLGLGQRTPNRPV